MQIAFCAQILYHHSMKVQEGQKYPIRYNITLWHGAQPTIMIAMKDITNCIEKNIIVTVGMG